MKKNEIEIKISTKDKVYLAIILCLIIAVLLVFVYVPRYYKLKYANNSSTSTNTQNSGSPNQTPPSSSGNTSPITQAQAQDSYCTKVMVLLADSGDMFKTFKNYLTADNVINTALLGITDYDFLLLENMAKQIYDNLTPIIKDGKVYQADIVLYDQLITDINSFKDYLNNCYEKANKK